MSMSDGKVPCAACGSAILPRTAKEHAGRCVPCFRKMHEAGEEVPCVSCGRSILPSVAEDTGGRCARCAGRMARMVLWIAFAAGALLLVYAVADAAANDSWDLLIGIGVAVGLVAVLVAVGMLSSAGTGRGEYLCLSCDTRFTIDQISSHAERVAAMSAARAAAMFGTSDVLGSITVLKMGRAYCPKCVVTTDGLTKHGRTVVHRPRDE